MTVKLQADVSGGDILKGDYSIVVCTEDGKTYAGYKFSKKMTSDINSRYGQDIYRYKKSKTGKKYLKVRLYSIVVSLLIKDVLKQLKNQESEFILHACRDFDGHKGTIEDNIRGMRIINPAKFTQFIFEKLPSGSPADELAYHLNNGKPQKRYKKAGGSMKLTFNTKFSLNLGLNDLEKYCRE